MSIYLPQLKRSLMNEHSAYLNIKQQEIDNDNAEVAGKFSHRIERDTGYLAYRDLPQILNAHSQGKNVLDYGCGAGYSTMLLDSWGYNVVGVDISTHMINSAKKKYPGLDFHHMKINELPFLDNSFDVVVSIFVLFDIPSLKLIETYASEAKRVLKENGIFIGITGSEYFHKHNWLTAINDVDKNKALISGQSYAVNVTDVDIVFTDFYYSNEDYTHAFKNSGLNTIATYFPKGKTEDNIDWLTEWELAPYTIYVCASGK